MLQIKNLSVKYHNAENSVLNNINFTTYDGEFILITGNSGCGKSTLLKAINGIIKKDEIMSGEILIDNKNITAESTVSRSKYIGSVLQNADEQIVFERVEDELAFPLENLSVEQNKMPAIIQKFANIMQLNLNAETATLSGGQKQRLITATTLSMQQKLLLFDEPLANLDTVGAIQLLKLLRQLCDTENYTVIFVEHRTDLVLDFIDRVLLLENSNIKTFTDKAEFQKEQMCVLKKYKINLDNKLNANNTKSIIFNLENVSLKFHNRTIIENLNYQFIENETYVISGVNGCGKTSLISLLTGIYKPTTGRIISSLPKKHNFKHIGLVMQNPNYQLFMPDVISELKLQSTSPDFLEFIIETLNLNELLTKHPQMLSEGQKRRVGFGAILSTQPRVLILDEPSVGQDFANMMKMLTVIKKLQEQKPTTVISISHDQRCDKLLGNVQLKMENKTLIEM